MVFMSPNEKCPECGRATCPYHRHPTKDEKDLGRLPEPWKWDKDLDGRWAARKEADGHRVSVHDAADPPDGRLAITIRSQDECVQPSAPVAVFLEVARANGYL